MEILKLKIVIPEIENILTDSRAEWKVMNLKTD